MQVMDMVKEVMKIKEVRPAMLADRLGISLNAMSMRFTQKNVSIDKLSEMLKAMDYKIVIVPRETRVSEGSFEIK